MTTRRIENCHPIFILSCGPRCGSTMLQRLITSSGKALVWGESGGALNHLRDAMYCYQQMLGKGNQKFKFGYGGNGDEQYRKFLRGEGEADDLWIASMNPSLKHFQQTLRQQMLSFYAEPAKQAGYDHWGVKEILADQSTVDVLKQLFPSGKFIYLLRHPFACLTSIKQRRWMDQREEKDPLGYYCEHWRTLAEAFRRSKDGICVYYERMANDSEYLADLERYLNISGLQAQFTKLPHSNWSPKNSKSLTWWERQRAKRILGDEMSLHGYEQTL